MYHFVLKKLNLSPSECIAFEDSANGVSAAVKAGIKTVVTVRDFTVRDNFTGAAIVLDSLGDPDMPFRVIAGEAGGATFVDLNFLKTLNSEN